MRPTSSFDFPSHSKVHLGRDEEPNVNSQEGGRATRRDVISARQPRLEP
jgi:hypothetical protein